MNVNKSNRVIYLPNDMDVRLDRLSITVIIVNVLVLLITLISLAFNITLYKTITGD